jgi:hypothetical protein
MKWLRQILIFLVIVGGVMGWKFYSKSQARTSTKTQLVTICASDKATEKDCLSAIDSYYDNCFDNSYSLGGRRQSGGLDSRNLADCINSKAGQPWFAVETQK